MMQEFKKVELQDLFDLEKSKTNDSSFTISFISSNKGNIPVYGATKIKNYASYGYIEDNLDGVKYFKDCLTFNIDGSIGCFYRKGKFSLSEKVIPLFFNDNFKDIVDYDYISYSVMLSCNACGFGFGYKPNRRRISPITILLPIKSTGEFDLQKQKEIAKRYKKIEVMQSKFNEWHNFFKNVNVVVELQQDLKEIELGDKNIFKISIGERVLKKDVKDKGVPIYSSNVLKIFGYNEELEYYQFDKAVLIWGIDGVFEWNIIPKNTKFIPTDHCGVLQVNDDKIDVEYLLYELRATKLRYGFDRIFRASLTNIESVIAKIPVDKEGNFDLAKQKELANKYKKIANFKSYLISGLENLQSCSVLIES